MQEEKQVTDDDAVVEVADDFADVMTLQKHGINVGDLKKLKESGIHTVSGIRMTTRKDLAGIKGISDGKVDKILEAVNKSASFGFLNGNQVARNRHSILRLSTGSAELDKLLGGGVETASITEAIGEFRCGKTQLAHTLCVTVQLPTEMGGGNGRAVFIDTEGTFRPERIREISQRYGLDPDVVLSNILVGRALTHEHQMELIQAVTAKMVESTFRLLVVDSATALFRVDFSGRGELAERQQKLARMLSHLIKIAEQFNVAVWLTNQVVADPGAAAMFVADPKKPIGGNIMGHMCTTRIMLKKGRGETRIAKIYDSPSLPENEATFQISPGGVIDATG